jgi:hypothetical protein
MAFYSLSMLEIARVLAAKDDAWTDIEVKFIEHFVLIVDAMHTQGLWDEQDGFFYDVFHAADGGEVPIRVRSIVGVLPLLGEVVLGPDLVELLGNLRKRFAGFLGYDELGVAGRGRWRVLAGPDGDALAVGVIPPGAARRVLARVFDENEFLSPHGLRALSKYHEAHPLSVELAGTVVSVDYEPAESRTGMFGGNSNWRGPVWMPINALLVEALQRFARHLGASYTVELPTASGKSVTLDEAADELSRRLVSLFVPDDAGRLPAAGGREWPNGLLWFHEYFHGDTGAGLGASHQTGWSGLVSYLICRPDPFAGDRQPWEL